MQIARNVLRLSDLVADLVNLVTPEVRGGRPVTPLAGDDLVEAIAGRLSGETAASLRAAPDAADRLSALARRLRAAIVAETAADRAGEINALLDAYRVRPYLVNDVDQPYHLHFHGSGETTVEWLGGELATVLALTVDGYGEDRFGRCQAHHCDAVYVDTTRNGSRRYCSTACTARAKTAAYRGRRTGEGY